MEEGLLVGEGEGESMMVFQEGLALVSLLEEDEVVERERSKDEKLLLPCRGGVLPSTRDTDMIGFPNAREYRVCS